MKSIDLNTLFKKYKLLIAFISTAGFAIIMLSTRNYGAGLSPDSVDYIATARNLIAGTGFVSYDGAPVVFSPPLYPALLALIGKLFGRDPLSFANILNALIFGLIVCFGGRIAFKLMSSFPVFALMGTLAILVSPPLFNVLVMAWSEPLFILFVVLSIFFANSYIEKKDIISLILLSLSVALSCLTRYIGVSLILWGALIVLVFNRNSLKNRIVHLSLFVLVSTLPLGIWLIRNYSISNTLFGSRGSSPYSLSQELGFMFDNLIYWYIPGWIVDHRSILMLVSAAVGFMAGLTPKDSWQSVKVSLRQISSTVLFVITYTVFLVISTTTTSLEPISNRYLSPIYVPLTLLILILAQAYVEPYRRRFSNTIVNTFLVIGIVFCLVYPMRSTFINAVNMYRGGLRYSSQAWIDSQTIQYLLQHPKLESECTIYTNDPYATYILAHLKVKLSPSKWPYEFPEIINDISKLKGSWPEESKACLVWFDVNNRNDLFTIDELQTIANLAPFIRLQDGAIYSVTRK